MEQKHRSYIINRVANGYTIRPQYPQDFSIFDGDVYIAVTITAAYEVLKELYEVEV